MTLCPEIEFAPVTAEGRAALDVIDRHGVWRRAGMSGGLVGLDLAEAMASLPEGDLDRDRARSLLIAAEAPYLAAWWVAEEAAVESEKAAAAAKAKGQ